MRVFIAYFPPDKLREKIEKIQKEIKKLDAISAKFVEKENLHISFSFLGERNNINEIIKNFEKLKEFQKFEAKLKNLLLIPNKDYIRVIAIGVESLLAESLRKKIFDIFGGDSKPLHLTLCRVKSVYNKNRIVDYANSFRFEEEFTIDNISLVKSTLTSSGPIYEIIHQISL